MPQGINRRQLIKISPAIGLSAMASQVRADEAPKDEPNPLLTVSPRSEDQRPWLMPAHFGSPAWPETARSETGDLYYDDVTRISISYHTDENLLTSYLPYPFQISGPPIVTVGYTRNQGISWLAGGDYNIIAVSVRATYPEKVNEVSGTYPLVLWEDLTEPILAGREKAGLPKIYGEIEDYRISNGVWETSLSNSGRTMLEMQATELMEVTPDALKRMNKDGQNVNVLGWKYIPDETASNAILSYGTAYPMSFQYREAWSAKGTLQWHARKWEELPTQAHIVNALNALPVKQIVSCDVSKGSTVLHSGMVRRLL